MLFVLMFPFFPFVFVPTWRILPHFHAITCVRLTDSDIKFDKGKKFYV